MDNDCEEMSSELFKVPIPEFLWQTSVSTVDVQIEKWIQDLQKKDAGLSTT
jgi:hypothetical protein